MYYVRAHAMKQLRASRLLLFSISAIVCIFQIFESKINFNIVPNVKHFCLEPHPNPGLVRNFHHELLSLLAQRRSNKISFEFEQ
jgi:hypothetical protein